MITKAQKRKWVAALRSGWYLQGRGRLCTVDGEYCCLGVLQNEIYGDAGWVEELNGNFLVGSLWSAAISSDLLPEEVQIELALLNDNGVSFPEIADWIEANVKAV